MKAREKRRRRQARKARQRAKWRPSPYWDQLATNEPMLGEVGYVGDIEDLREYPCNCVYCVNAPTPVEVNEGTAGICLDCGQAFWHGQGHLRCRRMAVSAWVWLRYKPDVVAQGSGE